MMGHLFEAECWERHTKGCSFFFSWLRKLKKAMDKALERKNGIIGTFIYEIMEIKRKGGERTQVACEEENEGE